MRKDKNIVSMSGAPVFRYTDGEKERVVPNGEQCIDEISNHIKQHIGGIGIVFHEILSDTVHIDVHHVKPTKDKPFHTLITSGMSDLPMQLPDNVEAIGFMELMITLPEYWQVYEEAFKDEGWYWPVRQLKFLARFPHKYDTWLGWGHTLPNGDPAEKFAENTLLNGVIILPSMHVPKEFYTLTINKDKTIEFLSVVPLYEEEMNLKLHKGTDALLDRLNKYGISDIVNIDRKNVAEKRFGIS